MKTRSIIPTAILAPLLAAAIVSAFPSVINRPIHLLEK